MIFFSMYCYVNLYLLFKTVSIHLLQQNRCVQLDKTVLKTQQLTVSRKGYHPVCDFPSHFLSICNLSRGKKPSDLYQMIRIARKDEVKFHFTSHFMSAAICSSGHTL